MTAASRPEAARILIVDGQPSLRALLERVLGEQGYTTASVSDGFEAVKVLETFGAVNLLVTDLVMPRMRGDELARRVRHVAPAVKVLYLSAHQDRLSPHPAILGNDVVLDKPFAVPDLLRAVSMLLARAREPGLTQPLMSGAPPQPTRRSLRVLLVEDVEADAALIQAELERLHFEVHSERVDTRVGLTAALERQTWDLILTDHTMPQLNAMGVLRILRDKCLSVPCVLVSGTASEETAAAAIKLGADDFVSKQNLRALGRSVARVLEDAETRRARSREPRLRLQNGQEFQVLEWTPDTAVLTGLVGLAPGQSHDCLLLTDQAAAPFRISVLRSEVAMLTAGSIAYKTHVTVAR